MRLAIGSTDIATAGSEIQLSADAQVGTVAKVLWARFKSHPGNTGNVAVGVASMSMTDGWVMANTDSVGLELDFRKYGGSVLASSIWMDAATNNDDVDWALILE